MDRLHCLADDRSEQKAEQRDMTRNLHNMTQSTPPHYAGTVTPWDLERCMRSSGNAFVDARRTDAIEYAFRIKDDLLSDLKKARHCLDAAIAEMERQQNCKQAAELLADAIASKAAATQQNGEINFDGFDS